MFKQKLVGATIILRLPQTNDAKELATNINNKKIAKWTANIPYPYYLSDAKEFISKQKKCIKKGTDLVYLITAKQSKKIIGAIGLHKIDKKNKKAELGYWLVPEMWGQGITTAAVGLLVAYGFKNIKLHRIYACCVAVNIGSKKVLEKNGFNFEGLEKHSVFRFGVWYDLLRYAILDSKISK